MRTRLIAVPPTDPLAEALRLAEEELATGTTAALAGNEGRARVCGRRAVAVFILAAQASIGTCYGSNAMAILQGISSAPPLPHEIRNAATRLLGGTRSIAAGETYSVEPLADAVCIINYIAAAPR